MSPGSTSTRTRSVPSDDGDFSELSVCETLDLSINNISLIEPRAFRGKFRLYKIQRQKENKRNRRTHRHYMCSIAMLSLEINDVSLDLHRLLAHTYNRGCYVMLLYDDIIFTL